MTFYIIVVAIVGLGIGGALALWTIGRESEEKRP